MNNVNPKQIDALLPQTQCGECSYAGCMPYAQALALGNATIDRCPPGGVATLKALGALLEIDPSPYLAAVATSARPPSVAVIREAECIGCTKCITACPVDAIIGTAKKMHAVITHECTGCGLCVEPCPMDCIDSVTQPAPTYSPAIARERFAARQSRLLRDVHEKQQSYRQKRQLIAEQDTVHNKAIQEEVDAKQAYILQALARVNAKKSTK